MLVLKAVNMFGEKTVPSIRYFLRSFRILSTRLYLSILLPGGPFHAPVGECNSRLWGCWTLAVHHSTTAVLNKESKQK